VQTSIAEGTPFGFGMRTPSPAFQTAIAEGTPIAALRGQGGGGRKIIARVAAALSIDPAELQTELQAPGATIANVAAKHDVGRETIKSALIAATQQRLSDAVASGAISQDAADQSQNQFAANIDALLDAPGGSMGMPPPGQYLAGCERSTV
jgi:hypothetical protein